MRSNLVREVLTAETMIVTLTLDPAADQTLGVDRIDPGNVHRVVGQVEIEVLG
jgi:hypothetical protein